MPCAIGKAPQPGYGVYGNRGGPVAARTERFGELRSFCDYFTGTLRLLRANSYFCTNNIKNPVTKMENTIRLHDRNFKIMIPAEQIDQAVEAVAQRINADYAGKETPLFLGILNGSFMFMSDLIKKIEFQNELSFVKLASYDGTCSTGCVKSLIGLNNSIEGRHVIIVEDIVDTGESIEHMIKELEARNPASIEVCTLFFKPGSYRKQLPIKYRAMEIGNEFIVGYGLDYDQLGRSLKDIYVVTE